jgi:hypothetical protein
MDTIADELLDGVWEMSVLPNGEVRVTLSWRLPPKITVTIKVILQN